MNQAVKKNVKRVVAALLFFLLFLLFAVEVQIQRLVQEANTACKVSSVECMRAQIAIARWQTPFSSRPMRAAETAYQMILQSDLSIDKKYRLFNELRTSLYGTRHMFRPEGHSKKSAVLTKVDEALGLNTPQRIRKAGAEEPVYLLQILSQLSFFAWVIFVFVAIWQGMTASGDIIWPKFKRYLLYAVLSFFSWLLCLSFA